MNPALIQRLADLSTPDRYLAAVTGGRFSRKAAWVRYAGEKIADAVVKPGSRLMFNIAPRTGKSWMTSYATPLWFLEKWPHKRIILCSYAAEIADEFGRRCRNEIRDNPAVGIGLAGDSASASRWNTVEGGGMTCAGVGGSITGRGGDLLIIDDILKDWKSAYSPALRKAQWEWYLSTFLTRAEPGATVLINTTRWHPDDLCGRILNAEGAEWEQIIFPALAEPGDVLGRAVGESIVPERYSSADFKALHRRLGDATFYALFQQNPKKASPGDVYANFTEANVDAKVAARHDLPLHLSLDFNINPGMHGIIGQYDQLTDRITAIHELHRYRMSVQDLCKEFIEKTWPKDLGGARFPAIHVYGDASGNSANVGTGDTSYDIVRKWLAKTGMTVRLLPPRSNPPIVDRVNTVNDALLSIDGVRSYFIHPRCERLLVDLREQQKGPDGLPDKSNTDLGHAGDAEGYRLYDLRPIGGTLTRKAARASHSVTVR